MDHRPKKRFGQNFLRDRSILDKIIAAAELAPQSRVLEIGPGLGALTDLLLEEAGNLQVIELDRDLVERFRQRNDPRLQIHEGDVLRLDWTAILTEPPYTLVANLPYNISSQVVFKLLDHHMLFERMVLMFQKEVADRLCAGPGNRDYGILSVLCALYFDLEMVTRVAPGSFYPPPKVQSAVVAFTPLSAPRLPVGDEAFFRRVVKAAFAQRRKTLRNTLGAGGFNAEVVRTALAEVGIDPTRRGETLDLKEFVSLAQALATMQESADAGR
ncbi:MAG: ribosomal RNA small subunit methyltransferase A [Desulfuromonas sp.]|nr:MAG: ribosomal RNA small subunit methyltransferase A [Desulfuromonas sp.]